MKINDFAREGALRWIFSVLFVLSYLVLLRSIEWHQLIISPNLYTQLGIGFGMGVGTCLLLCLHRRDFRQHQKLVLFQMSAQIVLVILLSIALRLSVLDVLAIAMLLIEPVTAYLMLGQLGDDQQS